MSYMVGYGARYPQRIHHRGSSLPSVSAHPAHIACKAGSRYFLSPNPNPNLLVGAVVGGPNSSDYFPDSRPYFQESEPTTYINAPLVGLLAFFSAHPWFPPKEVKKRKRRESKRKTTNIVVRKGHPAYYCDLKDSNCTQSSMKKVKKKSCICTQLVWIFQLFLWILVSKFTVKIWNHMHNRAYLITDIEMKGPYSENDI